MKGNNNVLALVLVIVIMLITITGCSGNNEPLQTGVPTLAQTSLATAIPTRSTAEETASEQATEQGTIITPHEITNALSDPQRNSISMLNHLAILTQEINASKNSRMYLEDAYSLLINNSYPNAIDSRTLSQLTSILDTLEKYRMIAAKRERLEYMYEQNRAQAIRSAVPSPLGLIGAVQSFSLSKLVASVVYMAVDSVTSYSSHSTQVDMQYLQDGWVLDDEAATALHNGRKDTFSYMVRIVGDYNLPGDLALSEANVDEFVSWANNDNVVQRIQFLETNVGTFQALGTYWITLAESYFDNSDYAKCLSAITSYEALGTRIFRKDYELSRVLPLAIISAGAVLSGDEYIQTVEHYIELINQNTDYDDWISHYFAAQTYIDLYARTNDSAYLQRAYDLAINNVNSLVNDQRSLNEKYLTSVVTATDPDGASKEQKEDVKQYNQMLNESRKTELPPVSEPLLLNCELLFSLASELDITVQEKAKVESILHQKGTNIFLTAPLDFQFWFDTSAIDAPASEVSFNGKELIVPASLVSANTVIKVNVTDGITGEETVFEDWSVVKVDRKHEGELDTFAVTYTSADAKEYKYAHDSVINITLFTSANMINHPLVFEYTTIVEKVWVIFDSIGFDRVK